MARPPVRRRHRQSSVQGLSLAPLLPKVVRARPSARRTAHSSAQRRSPPAACIQRLSRTTIVCAGAQFAGRRCWDRASRPFSRRRYVLALPHVALCISSARRCASPAACNHHLSRTTSSFAGGQIGRLCWDRASRTFSRRGGVLTQSARRTVPFCPAARPARRVQPPPATNYQFVCRCAYDATTSALRTLSAPCARPTPREAPRLRLRRGARRVRRRCA